MEDLEKQNMAAQKDSETAERKAMKQIKFNK